jgi:Tol biopolymer transport system component/DNA-binding winged helix-turn-helix (wHTH) protein
MMGARARSSQLVRFATFELDLQTGELRKGGQKLKLGGQPFQVLSILLERPGEVVTREELQKHLWPDTFVDVDHSLNAAINKIREVLGDSAENPRFVETLARRGYRFIGPVEGVRAAATRADLLGSGSPASPPQRRFWHIFILVAACALLAGAGLIVYKRPHGLAPLVRALTQLTFDDGLQVGATWSPDGRFIAYSSDRGGKFDIWVQQVTGGDPVQITKGSGQHRQPAWSPDGKYIAYRSDEGDGGLYLVPALGGAGLERKISPFGYYPRWSPDSSQILFRTMFAPLTVPNQFYVIGLDGTPPREVFGDFVSELSQKDLYAVSAAWHPDGNRITLWLRPYGPGFWTLPLAGGPAVKSELSPELGKLLDQASGGYGNVRDADFDFAWAPSGRALYWELTLRGAGNIWRRMIDPQTLRPVGLERLTTNPGLDTELAVSPDGRKLAFTAETQHIRTWLFPFDASVGRIAGPGQAVTSQGIQAWLVNLSRDGKKLAFCGDRGGKFQLRQMLLPDAPDMPVVADDSYWRQFPQWSPDGIRLAYTRYQQNGDNQIMLWSSYSRNEEPLTTPSRNEHFVYDWSPDGAALLISQVNADTGRTEVWQLPAAASPQSGQATRKIISDPDYDLWQPHFSPDGRWIVFDAVRNAQSSLYVVPTAGGAWIPLQKASHGTTSRDGPQTER